MKVIECSKCERWIYRDAYPWVGDWIRKGDKFICPVCREDDEFERGEEYETD